jgi:EAL domain-containing protein (putative c-di-GMP-specific phosphodiesterase class I)/GGDEF domain-containing protein
MYGKTEYKPLEDQKEKLAEFLEILQEGKLQPVYQPIVSLVDGGIFGYEALSRGPEGSVFHSPLNLFCYAEQSGHLYAIEQLAREKAVTHAILQHKRQMLFINISAPILEDPQFVPGKTLEILERNGLSPHNVVFEITERSSIEDFSSAKKILEHYRSQGYKIAIDDAGAGYSSLQAIAELHPDFIKVDRSLIENIHLDKIKEAILESFVAFADKMNIQLIAEGIEQMDELLKIARMGVHFAQGFLLGFPAAQPVLLIDELAKKIRDKKTMRYATGEWLTIGDLAAPIREFQQSALVSEVSQFFHRDESVLGTVIVQGDIPVGLLMRENLFRQLSGQYGFSLYWNRTVEATMDPEPLIVDVTMSPEQVSKLAMSREKKKLYDLVIITKEGKMAGVATIQSILECITQVRMESAKVANPLTGLPGNVSILKEMNRRIVDNRSFSVIYADLDYFKWYNDRYGFQKGDQLIQYTADVIQHAVMICGSPHDFVGHIGGDDFIAISETGDPERMCREIIRRFDLGVGVFFEEPVKGSVEDRYGNKVDSDGMTLSLSLVICESGASVSIEQISQAAAVLKKKSKSQKGSAFFRSTLGGESVKI